jgi:hypothetical protein
MENTITESLNKSFTITEISEVEHTIRNLVMDLTDDYKLKTDEGGIIGPLVKYGLLDLVFENSSGQFILVFCKGKNIGYSEERKKATENKLSISEYMQKYLSNIQLFLPVSLTIIDCCHTNDDSIWMEKYFYA